MLKLYKIIKLIKPQTEINKNKKLNKGEYYEKI
jgi:hypothetical protein